MQRGLASGVKPLDALAITSLVLCCAVWGVNQVALKVANDGIPPMIQAGLRSAVAGAILVAWMKARGGRLFARDGTLVPGFWAGLAFAANFMTLGPGLSLTEASRGVLFYYSAPFVVAIGAHFLIPGERLTLPKVAGLVLAFLGLVVSVSDRLLAAGGATSASLLGDLLCLVGGVAWAATTLIVRVTPLRQAAPEKTLVLQLLFSIPFLVAGSLLFGEPAIGPLTPIVVGAFLYGVIIVIVLSYLIWFWLLQRYPAGDVSAFTFLGPLFAVAAGHILLAEPIGWRHAVALLMIAAGLYLISKPTRRHKPA